LAGAARGCGCRGAVAVRADELEGIGREIAQGASVHVVAARLGLAADVAVLTNALRGSASQPRPAHST
jgi:hypothetical protein